MIYSLFFRASRAKCKLAVIRQIYPNFGEYFGESKRAGAGTDLI